MTSPQVQDSDHGPNSSIQQCNPLAQGHKASATLHQETEAQRVRGGSTNMLPVSMIYLF
jgi:hypothetical protein